MMSDSVDGAVLLSEFARRSQLGEFDDCESLACAQPYAPNICVDCHIPMEIQGDEYVCAQCRRIAAHADCHITTEPRGPCGKDAKHYGSSDPLKDKCTGIADMLIAKREEYTARIAKERGVDYKPGSIVFGASDAPSLAHLVPSTDALLTTASRYIEIQRCATANGTPFVKCGGVKNEVLGILLHIECAKRGEQRSKREIAEMIGLRTDGFSRGLSVLMMQFAAGNFIMESEEAARESMISSTYNRTLGAYLDARINGPLRANARANGEPEPSSSIYCELFGARYMQLMRSVIRCAIKHHICPQSQSQTKIVGIVWFIICAMGYPRAPQDASGVNIYACGIKRCTFIKFARAIKKSARLRKIVYVFLPQLRGRLHDVVL